MLTTFAVVAGLFAGGTGKVVVDVEPANAIVEIDGQRVANKRTIAVKAGKKQLRARASGYTTKIVSLNVGSGKTVRAKVRMVRTRTLAPKTVKKRPVVGRRPVARKPITRKPVARKPAVKKRPTTVKRTPKVKTRRPVVNRRPARGPATGNRRPPSRGVVNGGGTRGSRGGGGGGGSLRPLAVLSFVVGGLAVTGGYVVHGMAEEKADDFNRSRDRQEKLTLRDEAKGLDTASTVLYGVGATGIVLGAVLLAADPGPRRASIMPLPEGGAMVGYGGTF